MTCMQLQVELYELQLYIQLPMCRRGLRSVHECLGALLVCVIRSLFGVIAQSFSGIALPLGDHI